MIKGLVFFAALIVLESNSADAQNAKKSTEKSAPKTAFNPATYDSAMLQEFAWRPIGPAVTSGRVVDLAVAVGLLYLLELAAHELPSAVLVRGSSRAQRLAAQRQAHSSSLQPGLGERLLIDLA